MGKGWELTSLNSLQSLTDALRKIEKRERR